MEGGDEDVRGRLQLGGGDTVEQPTSTGSVGLRIALAWQDVRGRGVSVCLWESAGQGLCTCKEGSRKFVWLGCERVGEVVCVKGRREESVA